MKLIYTVMLISICIMAGCKERVKPVRLENCNNLKADDPKIIEFANKCVSPSNDFTIYEQPKVSETTDKWYIFYKGKVSADGYV
ncbi:MAG: hypothetical protein KJ760_19195, partial [Proteobacteria bacterium]|nr:hypothetical protein [Pseudomonadota bacterium]